jgi:hypothetical protein
LRPIKFRQPMFTNNKFSRFLYWGFIDGAFIGPETLVSTIEGAKKNSHQYTGLKDKNNKEIYEGDIIQEDDPDGKINYLIEWKEKEANFSAIDGTKTLRLYGIYWKHNCEVIGNIYENPELIQK